jgi:GntR family transcriptional regulator
VTQSQGAPASRPLWQQVLDDLERRIAAGDIVDRFPTDKELTEHYGVSRHTVREAVQRLRSRGWSTGTAGVGASSTRASSPSRSAACTACSGPSRRPGWSSAPRCVPRARATTRGSRPGWSCPLMRELVRLERLRYAGAEPLALDETWLPADIGRPVLDVDLTHAALYDVLSELSALRLTAADETLTPIVPDAELADLLDLDDLEGLLRVERWLGRRPGGGVPHHPAPRAALPLLLGVADRRRDGADDRVRRRARGRLRRRPRRAGSTGTATRGRPTRRAGSTGTSDAGLAGRTRGSTGTMTGTLGRCPRARCAVAARCGTPDKYPDISGDGLAFHLDVAHHHACSGPLPAPCMLPAPHPDGETCAHHHHPRCRGLRGRHVGGLLVSRCRGQPADERRGAAWGRPRRSAGGGGAARRAGRSDRDRRADPRRVRRRPPRGRGAGRHLRAGLPRRDRRPRPRRQLRRCTAAPGTAAVRRPPSCASSASPRCTTPAGSPTSPRPVPRSSASSLGASPVRR